jgi:tetratricopeptide (TPR) repeat protein
VLVLAGLDFAHRRYAESMAKYRLAYRYYSGVGDNVLAALALNGIGEVHARTGDPDAARRHFESALTPALAAQSNPMLLNIALNLANLHLERGAWPEAAAYYDGAEKLAAAQLIPQVKIQALENRGCCLARMGDPDGALACWTSAAELARGIEEKGLLRPVLHRIREHHRTTTRDRDRLRAAEDELAALAADADGDGHDHGHGAAAGRDAAPGRA